MATILIPETRRSIAAILVAMLMPAAAAARTGVAVVQRAPSLSGAARIDGSLHQLTPEAVALSGRTSISGELLLPGTPTLRLQGSAEYGGTLSGTGAAGPADYAVTLGGSSTLGRLVLRTDPVPLPVIDPPPPPAGTRTVRTSSRTGEVGDFKTIRNLDVSGNGVVIVPPGFYGVLSASGNATVVLGSPDATRPAAYGFERITLSGRAKLEVASRVVVTVARGFFTAGVAGASGNPEWFTLRVAEGDMNFTANATVYGYIAAPKSHVAVGANAAVTGGLVCAGLKMDGNGVLSLIAEVRPPRPPLGSIPYATGFEEDQGFQAGDLQGQGGWTVQSGAVRVDTRRPFDGARALRFEPGPAEAAAHLDFSNGESRVTFLEAFVETQPPAAGGMPSGILFSGGGLRLAAFEAAGRWEALDGTVWRPAGQSPGWTRLTARLAYPDGTWDLYLNSRLTLADLAMADTAPTALSRLALTARSAANVDLVFAGYENPVFADADADGLEDAWEQDNGLDPGRGDRNTDRDGDGLTNLREYLIGTRANVSDTDGDGASDGAEVAAGRNPLKGPIPDGGALRLQLHLPN